MVTANRSAMAQHSTTVLCVRKNGKARPDQLFDKAWQKVNGPPGTPLLQVIIMADGQVTRGNEIIKPNVRKVRRIGDNKVIGGFAGEQQRSPMMLFWWLNLMVMPCPSY